MMTIEGNSKMNILIVNIQGSSSRVLVQKITRHFGNRWPATVRAVQPRPRPKLIHSQAGERRGRSMNTRNTNAMGLVLTGRRP